MKMKGFYITDTLMIRYIKTRKDKNKGIYTDLPYYQLSKLLKQGSIKLKHTILQLEEEDEAFPEYELEYGFGTAKHFMPLPNTVVGSHCAWELRLNTVASRIPGQHRILKRRFNEGSRFYNTFFTIS